MAGERALCSERDCGEVATQEARYFVPPRRGLAFGDWKTEPLCDGHASAAAKAPDPPPIHQPSVRAHLRRSPVKRSRLRRRTPLRRTGRLRRHARKDFGQLWRWAMERANWRCEAKFSSRCEGRATQVHHVLPRGRGGTDELGNLLAVCWWCHQEIHAYPIESTARGLLRSGRSGVHASPPHVSSPGPGAAS